MFRNADVAAPTRLDHRACVYTRIPVGTRLRSKRFGVAPIVVSAALMVSACGPREAPPATLVPEAAPIASSQASSAPEPDGGGYIPVPRTGPTAQWKRAVDLFKKGNTLQFKDRLDEAIQAYQLSLAAFPTPEAYTFLGWTYSWQGRLDDAIAEARKAVALDPDYGNPYNDIGLYLITQGKLDNAVPWLRKAIVAKRYDERQFPHLNLGRIWTRKALFADALEAFEQCLRIWKKPSLPDFPAVSVVIAKKGHTAPTAERLADLRKSLTAYFDAWNAYDATALMSTSTPHPPDVTEAILQHLARAKLQKERRSLGDVRLVRFDDAVALVEADVGTDGRSERVQYVLQRSEGVWSVMGPAVVTAVEEEPASPSQLRIAGAMTATSAQATKNARLQVEPDLVVVLEHAQRNRGV
jgi:tetratricopeptide (TPR) repeat protein